MKKPDNYDDLRQYANWAIQGLSNNQIQMLRDDERRGIVIIWWESQPELNRSVPHRRNKPALIWENGTKEWMVHGLLHREDGPALVSKEYHSWWWCGKRVGSFYELQEVTGHSDEEIIAFMLRWGDITVEQNVKAT